MEIRIYSKDGEPRLAAEAGSNSTQTEEIQAGRVLSLSFTLPEAVMLDVNDYADFMGHRYRVTERYRPVQKSTREWEYAVRLYGVENLISRFLVLNTTDGGAEPVFSLTASPREHVALIVKCINEGFGTEDWKVGAVEGTENITVDYHGKYCDQGLKAVAEKVGTEYWIEGTTVNIGRCEHGERITMGYMNGLTKVQPDVADNNKVYTRLFPIGSSRNIDPARYGASRLHLPGGAGYVDVNTDIYGVIHHYEDSAFAGIYPRRTGTVSGVRHEERKGEDGSAYSVYYFKDAGLDFDPNDYDMAGLVKRVSFQEGSELAGLGNEDNGSYYLEVNFNSKTREFEIITLFKDEIQIPGGALVPEAGDQYILWNLRMPDEYYPRAEAELLEAVNKYNRTHGVDVACYKASTDYLWVNRLGVTLHAGQRVRLESREFFPETGYKDTRITRIVRRVDNPGQMDIDMSDALSAGFMDRIQGSIDEVKAYVQSSRGSLPDIIRTTDRTIPTDNNLFSARRIQRDFMSRTRDDRSAGRIASDRGFDAGNYVAGQSGATVRVLEDGSTYAEVDRLYVRMKALFESLTAVRTESLAGERLVTPAGAINCVRVEDCGDHWRCYFTAEVDGERIDNLFEAGDQARCNYFNAAQTAGNRLANKFYWRLVTGVGEDYIDLSKSDRADGSDEPAAGDVICHLGNRTKGSRQTAIRISTVLGNPPSITLLYGIDSYSLEGEDAVSMGVDATTGRPYLRCCGDAHFGSRDGTGSLLDYDSVTGIMDYRGRINLMSMVGDTSMKEVVESAKGAVLDTDVLFIQTASQADNPNLPLLNSSGNIAEYNGWTTNAPVWQRGDVHMADHLCQKKGNGSGAFSEPVCISGRDGEDGASFSNNLITNSNFIKGLSNWAADSGLMTVEIDAAKGSVMKWVVGVASRVFNGTSNVWKQGEVYTYSFWAKADDAGCKLRPSHSIADFGQTHTLTTEWVKYHGTINCTLTAEGGSLSISSLGAGTFYIADVKLEYGVNPDPQWSPHPYEMTGHDGVGIDRIEEEYYLSASRTELKGGAWSTVRQPWVAGHFYWTRSHIYYTDGTDKTVGEICATGEAGADGTPVYQLDLSNELAGVACDAQGNVTGTLPTSQASVYRGSHKVTSGVTYSIKEHAGAMATVDASGVVRMTSLTADAANVVVQASVDGLTLQSTMNVYKVKPGAAGGKGDKGDAAVVYSVLPSVNSVTRHADGSLSASMVTCTVYKTTGAATPVVSNDHTLSYQRLPDGAAGTLTRSNGVSAGVAVLDNTEAIIFELKNGATVLDRERVPVLSDVEGFGMGGENLVLNAGFMSRQFMAKSICRIDASSEGRFQGSNVLKMEAEGFDSDMWHGVWQPYPTNPHLLCEPDTYYSYSMWVYSPDITSFDYGAIWELNVRDKNNANLRYNTVDIVPTKSNGWQRISGRFKTPANAHSLACQWWIKRNGRLWVAKPQLVRGAILPDWAPSPYDFDYLAEVLKQGTTIDGGLVLSSLIKVGYDDAQGNRVVTAGMNGLLDPVMDDRDPAFWSGGDMIDAELSDENEDAAAYLMRHDGTGYFSKGAIRVMKDRIMVGDNVTLDKEGIKMVTDEGVAVTISNKTVETDFDKLESNQVNISTGDDISIPIAVAKDRYRPSTFITHRTVFKLASFTAKAKSIGTCTVHLGRMFQDYHINIHNPVEVDPIRTMLILELKLGDDTVYKRNVSLRYLKYVTADVGTISYTVDDTFTFECDQGGTYDLYLTFPSGTDTLTQTETLYGYYSVKGSVKANLGRQTLIGSNGLSSTWGETAFAINEECVIFRAGSYGFRITPDGIEKNSTGTATGWVKI